MILVWVGFTKEPLRGCPNCNAVNFNEYANEDDDSCILMNITNLGEYTVIDSTMDWSLTWSIDDYSITIDKDSCNYKGLKMNNVNNMENDFIITGKIIGDSLIIPSQFSSGYEIFETNGYFLGDSFWFK